MRQKLGFVGGVVFALALVVTCSSSNLGGLGDLGPGGGDGAGSHFDIASSEAAPGPACTPYQSFCDGNNLVSCTRSGQDASLIQDCSQYYYGSATNPAKCYSACPQGPSGACCAVTNPSCVFSITSPFSLSATEYQPGYDSNGVDCSITPGCPGKPLSLTMIESKSTCPGAFQEVLVSLDRAKVSAGQSYTLPNAGISITEAGDAGSCSQWTGSVTFNTDVPNWQFSINATCSSGTVLQLTGTFSGHT
jgi:hypothetical protein